MIDKGKIPKQSRSETPKGNLVTTFPQRKEISHIPASSPKTKIIILILTKYQTRHLIDINIKKILRPGRIYDTAFTNKFK